MTTQQRPHVRLDDPGELLASVPALLGFHPVDSLVVVGLHGRRRTSLGVVLRTDLPSPSQCHAVAEYLLLPLCQHNTDAVVLIVVGARTSDHDLPHRDVLATCGSILTDAGYPVVHQLWTSQTRAGRRWCCYDVGACHGVLRDPATTALATLTHQLGMITYGSREDIVATLASDPDDVLAGRAAALAHLTVPTEPGTDDPVTAIDHSMPEHALRDRSSLPGGGEKIQAMLGWVQAALTAAAMVATPPRLSEEEVIRLACALSEHRVRDTCLDFDGLADVAAAERLWTVLIRATPPPQRSEPACLLAMSAYARGDVWGLRRSLTVRSRHMVDRNQYC